MASEGVTADNYGRKPIATTLTKMRIVGVFEILVLLAIAIDLVRGKVPMPESATPVVIPSSRANVDVADPSPRTTEAMWRETGHLKELMGVQIDEIQRGIAVAHADLVRVPTEIQQKLAAVQALLDVRFQYFEEKFAGADEASLARFEGVRTRFEAMDKAIRLLQDISDKFPDRIDEKILALRDVLEQKVITLGETSAEKFLGVQKQFDERDVRTDTSRVSDKTAVDAALAAQEKSFSKQGETFSEATAKSEESFTKQIDQMGALHRTAIEGLQAQFNDLKDRFNRGEGRSEGTDTSTTSRRAVSSQMIAFVAMMIGLAGLAFGIIMAVRR